jgi:hypothetical protein
MPFVKGFSSEDGDWCVAVSQVSDWGVLALLRSFKDVLALFSLPLYNMVLF